MVVLDVLVFSCDLNHVCRNFQIKLHRAWRCLLFNPSRLFQRKEIKFYDFVIVTFIYKLQLNVTLQKNLANKSANNDVSLFSLFLHFVVHQTVQ
jgi:hypothetical protein